jgi:hypothetical protein
LPTGGQYYKNLAPHDNPLVLRAFDYTGTTMTGTTNATRSVLELVFPTKHERYRFSFWGEMNVGTGRRWVPAIQWAVPLAMAPTSCKCRISGAILTRVAPWFVCSKPQRAVTTRLGMQYINRFSADIRMSVAQRITSPDTLGQTPEFDDREGLYMGDYRVFMPLGALHYQSHGSG